MKTHNSHESNPLLSDRRGAAAAPGRRMVLRGAGGFMLGLPLLEAFMPRKASAQTATRSPFVLIVVGANGVCQAGTDLGGVSEPEQFWPTATGTLTRASLTADGATRATGVLSDYADKLLIVRGINLAHRSSGCSHAAGDAQILTSAQITTEGTNAKALGISVDTAIAAAKNPPGRDPLVLHAGMYSPGGTGYDIPGYISYVTARQARVYIDSPYRAYQQIIVGVGDGTAVGTLEAQAQLRRATRGRSINDILRPQLQALLARKDLSQGDRARLDQHLTAIRDIEVMISTTTASPISEADVTKMKGIDPNPYNQANHETQIRLHMQLMAFSAAADYSRVAVLKIGDREDDHVYTMNGQRFNFHEASHRKVSNSLQHHHNIDRLHLGHYKYLLDTVSAHATPTGSLLDQGVTIYTNQCATGAHSFSNIPWIQAGSANGFFKQGQYVTVGTGQQPGGKQDGIAGDASSAMNKMLNTLLTAAGVTKPGGAPTDDFGDPALPKGIFSELVAKI